ncbi:MAG: YolD-like family protein [Firmicutes bacterium]|jgi:hypothetical protein|nr:YolD-like family protein [Bacillota bacterium]HPU01077.1 YolD-like family protein [Bacillota bacterium]
MKKKLYHQFACSSLMLPEHRAALARHRREEAWKEWQRRHAPPDEQQLEQFQRLVEQSMQAGLPLKITCLEKGRERCFTGVAHRRQPHPDKLQVQVQEGTVTIPLGAIINLEAAP